MGERGPVPKENPQRRNKESKTEVIRVDPDRKVRVPSLGSYRLEIEVVEGRGATKEVYTETETVDFGPTSRAMWQQLWESPLAAGFRPEMHAALRRWVVFADRFFDRGDHTVEKAMLALEKEFGMTLFAQRRARMLFFSGPQHEADAAADPVDHGATTPAVRTDAERRARVKAVAND